MSILVDDATRVVVSGITGREGTFHTLRNRAYGTQVVAGVTPGKAGQDVEGIPVFDTIADAVEETGANTSLIFVPARFATEAILEAADSELRLVVCITEGIPVRDMARTASYLRGKPSTLVGPNCPGVISASRAVDLKVPLVVRMKGTNEEIGKKMLKDSGLPIISADTMAEAAEKVVAAAKGR